MQERIYLGGTASGSKSQPISLPLVMYGYSSLKYHPFWGASEEKLKKEYPPKNNK